MPFSLGLVIKLFASIDNYDAVAELAHAEHQTGGFHGA